jgi:hypothetical protein
MHAAAHGGPVSAIDDWFDGDDVDLASALADPGARRELVERAMLEVLLPRMPAPRMPPPRRRSRTAVIAAVVVAIAMVIVLLLGVRPHHAVDFAVVTPERNGRVVTGGERTALAAGGTTIAASRPHVVDTPLGQVTLAAGTRAVLRASESPAALYVEVIAGEASFGGEVLGAGQRAAYGDWFARRRLGPRVVVEVVDRDAQRLAGRLGSGELRTYVVSSSAALDVRAEPGERVQLILSPSEREVLVVTAPDPR